MDAAYQKRVDYQETERRLIREVTEMISTMITGSDSIAGVVIEVANTAYEHIQVYGQEHLKEIVEDELNRLLIEPLQQLEAPPQYISLFTEYFNTLIAEIVTISVNSAEEEEDQFRRNIQRAALDATIRMVGKLYHERNIRDHNARVRSQMRAVDALHTSFKKLAMTNAERANYEQRRIYQNGDAAPNADPGRTLRLLRAKEDRAARQARGRILEREYNELIAAQAAADGFDGEQNLQNILFASHKRPVNRPGAVNQDRQLIEVRAEIARLERELQARRALGLRPVPAMEIPPGMVNVATLDENIREAIPFECIRYENGVGLVKQEILRIIGAAHNFKRAIHNKNNIIVTDRLAKQIVKQELVRVDKEFVRICPPPVKPAAPAAAAPAAAAPAAPAPKENLPYADMVKAKGECPLCFERRQLFKVHFNHPGEGGACQVCILDNLHDKLNDLARKATPAEIILPNICQLEHHNCPYALTWYEAYKVSCTTPLIVDGVDSCERFKQLYRRFIDMIEEKKRLEIERYQAPLRLRAQEDLDRELETLETRLRDARARERIIINMAHAAQNGRIVELTGKYGRDLAKRREDNEARRIAEQRRVAIERGNITTIEGVLNRGPQPGALHRDRNLVAICPRCLEIQQLGDACLTLVDHVCNPDKIVPEIVAQFPIVGNSTFCACCGRPEVDHNHYHVRGTQLHNGTSWNEAECLRAGGGGRGEMVARMIGLRDVVQRYAARNIFNMTPERRRDIAIAMRNAAIEYVGRRHVHGVTPAQIQQLLQNAEIAAERERHTLLQIEPAELQAASLYHENVPPGTPEAQRNIILRTNPRAAQRFRELEAARARLALSTAALRRCYNFLVIEIPAPIPPFPPLEEPAELVQLRAAAAARGAQARPGARGALPPANFGNRGRNLNAELAASLQNENENEDTQRALFASAELARGDEAHRRTMELIALALAEENAAIQAAAAAAQEEENAAMAAGLQQQIFYDNVAPAAAPHAAIAAPPPPPPNGGAAAPPNHNVLAAAHVANENRIQALELARGNLEAGREIPEILRLTLYLGNFLDLWARHLFRGCFVRRRGGTRRFKSSARRAKKTHKKRKGHKTRKSHGVKYRRDF